MRHNLIVSTGLVLVWAGLACAQESQGSYYLLEGSLKTGYEGSARYQDRGAAAESSLKAEWPSYRAQLSDKVKAAGGTVLGSNLERTHLTSEVFKGLRASNMLGRALTGAHGQDVTLYRATGQFSMLLRGPSTPNEGLRALKASAVSQHSTATLYMNGAEGSAMRVTLTLAEVGLLHSDPTRFSQTRAGAMVRGEWKNRGEHRATKAWIHFDGLRLASGKPIPAAVLKAVPVVEISPNRALGWHRSNAVRPPARALSPQDTRLVAEALGKAGPETVERVRELRAGRGPISEAERSFLRGIAGEVNVRAHPDRSPLGPYRRADGTVDWKGASKAGLLNGANGLGTFTMALFLKEFAAAVATNDKTRVEEFFDAVASTEFFKTYGLFAVGAAAGQAGYNAAYQRYLHRYLKPAFVNNVLRTNMALAAGLALPQLVSGTFEGKTFAISLASLGLSSFAVQGAMSALPWVKNLRSVAATSRRALRVGGWFYQAAELAVVLTVAEKIEGYVHERLTRRELRTRLAAAARRAALAKDEDFPAALAAYQDAWADYREFLFAPALETNARFLRRVERLGTRSKQHADATQALRSRVKDFEGLPLEAFLARRAAKDQSATGAELDALAQGYSQAFHDALEEIETAPRRGGAFLTDVRGTDVPAFSRAHLTNPSRNRLQTYDDEREAMQWLARQRPEQRDELKGASDQLARLSESERNLFNGEDGLFNVPAVDDARPEKQGASQAVERE